MCMQEDMNMDSDSWKEEQNMHMGGIPNIGKVRILVIYCKRMNILKYINIDM